MVRIQKMGDPLVSRRAKLRLVKSVFSGEDGHEEAVRGAKNRCDFEGRGSWRCGNGAYRRHNISDVTFYTWRKKYRGMETEELKRLKQLEAENRKRKRLLADEMLYNDALRAALSKKY